MPPAISVDTSAAAPGLHVGLVGFVRGDVNGSYSSNGTEALPDEYFVTLAEQLNVNPSQFGIYGA